MSSGIKPGGQDDPASRAATEEHLVCLRWAAWHRSRKLYAPRPPLNLLAKLRIPDPTIDDGPDAPNDPALQILNRAINAQPMSPAKMAFLCFYLWHASMPALMRHYGRSRGTIWARIIRFRARAILAQHLLISHRYADERVILMHQRRIEAAKRAGAMRIARHSENASKSAEIY